MSRTATPLALTTCVLAVCAAALTAGTANCHDDNANANANADAGRLPHRATAGRRPPDGRAAAPAVAVDLASIRTVYSEASRGISLALGLAAVQSSRQDGASVELYAAFGSWGVQNQSQWQSYVRRVLPTPGPKSAGDGAHETAGTDLVVGEHGPVYCFEADGRQKGGGPALYGSGIRYDNGSYWWQGVSASADGRIVVAAAARRFSAPLRSDVYASTDGGNSYSLVGSSGAGIPIHQLALTRGPEAGAHLVFRSVGAKAPNPENGTAALVVVRPASVGDTTRVPSPRDHGQHVVTTSERRQSGDAAFSIEELAYDSSFTRATGCEGLNIGAEVDGIDGIVVGTFSGDIAWRGGNCAAVGVLAAPVAGGSASTSRWLALGGSDVTAIAALAPATFAALVEDTDGSHGGNKLHIIVAEAGGAGAFNVVQSLPLPGLLTGGLAVVPTGGSLTRAAESTGAGVPQQAPTSATMTVYAAVSGGPTQPGNATVLELTVNL